MTTTFGFSIPAKEVTEKMKAVKIKLRKINFDGMINRVFRRVLFWVKAFHV
jgi:hypothetical protein